MKYKNKIDGKVVNVVFVGKENAKIEYKGLTTNISRYALDEYYEEVKSNATN